MWFKNLTVFQFSEPFLLTAEALTVRLESAPFRPCGSQEWVSYGWTPALGRHAQTLVHSVNGCLLFCLRAEEKILPMGVIKEAVETKVAEIEQREQRAVRRKERETLRDEVVQDLLPRAFTRTRETRAYLDIQGGWLVVDSVSRKGVEELTGLLRKTLGSLPITPLRVAQDPVTVMTAWLAAEAPPDGLRWEDECELRDHADEGGVVRCKGQDLVSDEIRAHLQAGKQITRLALTWADRLAFVLAEDLSVRRLRFLDLIQEQLHDLEADTEEQIADAEFALMSGELGQLLPRLLEVFGGGVAGSESSAMAAA